MNFKALVTTLLLGSSSLASADSFSVSGSVRVGLTSTDPCTTPATTPIPYRPAPSRPVTYQPAPYHPVVYQQPTYTSNVRMNGNNAVYVGWIGSAPQWRNNQWFDLTTSTRIIGAGHREEFLVGAARGQFRALRLQALGHGSTSINNVTVEFTDGSRQQLIVKQKLDASNPQITVDLDGNSRSISRILVYGLSQDTAAYKIQAL